MKNYIEYFKGGKRITNGRNGETEVTFIGDLFPYIKAIRETGKNTDEEKSNNSEKVVSNNILIPVDNSSDERYYFLGKHIPLFLSKNSFNPIYRINRFRDIIKGA